MLIRPQRTDTGIVRESGVCPAMSDRTGSPRMGQKAGAQAGAFIMGLAGRNGPDKADKLSKFRIGRCK